MSYLLKSRSEPKQLIPASLEEQKGKITEVLKLLGNLPMEMPNFLSDATIRRFLRAKNWSTVQAAKSLKEAASWRRQYKPEKIRWENVADSENEAKRAYIPDYLDKNGRMVFVTLPATKTKTSEEDHIKYLVYNLENLVLNSEDAQEESVVWMSDFRGLIAVAILTNPPKIFESFWKIMKHFLEPKMNEKVKFVYNNSESKRILADMFDLDKLESTFGGRNTAGLDINKYAEKMRRRDQIRGAYNMPMATPSFILTK
ncbi:unnamed protein product [Urochloa humidicola]